MERWTLSTIARQASDAIPAGAAGIPYDGGGPWDPRSCSTVVEPHTEQLSTLLRREIPALPTIRALRCSPLTVTSRNPQTQQVEHTLQMSLHSVGRALDVMIPGRLEQLRDAADRTQPVGPDLGDRIANWLIEHAPGLGIQLVIWRGSAWQP